MIISGPRLALPPPVVIDALEQVGRSDADAEQWVIDLERFYQKQDLTSPETEP